MGPEWLHKHDKTRFVTWPGVRRNHFAWSSQLNSVGFQADWVRGLFSLWHSLLMKIVIPPASTKLKGGYTGFTLSICPSVRLSAVDRIVSALYLQQYSSDPFHICTSYQATSEGVPRVMIVSKLKNFGEFFKFVTLTLSSFDLGSNMTQWYG